MINLIRVDCRLVHIQVLELWCSKYEIDCINIVTKKSVNPINQLFMQSAAKDKVSLKWFSNQSCLSIKSLCASPNKHMILIEDLRIALDIYCQLKEYRDFSIPLSIGNQPLRDMATAVIPGVYLLENEIKELEARLSKDEYYFSQYPLKNVN